MTINNIILDTKSDHHFIRDDDLQIKTITYSKLMYHPPTVQILLENVHINGGSVYFNAEATNGVLTARSTHS